MRLALLLPWLVILAVCVYIPVENARHAKPALSLPREAMPSEPPATWPADSPATLPAVRVEDASADEQLDARVFILGKYLLGAGRLFGDTQGKQFQDQFDSSARTPAERVAAAVVGRDLLGPDAALRRLDELATPDARAFSSLLRDGTPLPDEVRERYGFFAELAAARPEGPEHAALLNEAKKIAVGMIVAILVIGVAGLAGLGLLVTAIVMRLGGKLTPRMMPPLVPYHAPAYVQAFAVYLVLLTGSGGALNAVWPEAPLAARVATLLGSVAVAFAVPLVLGTPWSRIKPDWGLHTGRGVLREVGAGLTGYLASLPLLAVGVGATLILSRLANYDTSHPITESIREHPLLMFFLAAVFAPVTEELFFRGALLSHCRSWAGPFASAGLTAVIFAIIHPQGWPALPVLGSIGFCLAMIRQWRGSLIGPITAHAVHNGMIVLLLLAVVG